jgi:uncharacterized membrane protein
MKQWFPSGRWAAGLLLGSLCLNVALGTYVAVQWLRPELQLQLAAAAPPRLMERVANRLPAQDADILRRAFRSRQGEFAQSQAEYQQALLAAVGTLAQPKLDASVLRSAVMQARDKRLKVGDLVIDTFVEAFTQMSPKGRQQLVGSLRRW